MKKILFATLASMSFFALSSAAMAGDCMITYHRVACAGQEATSYAKCDGKQMCDKEKAAATQEACAAEAAKACDNDRTDITKSKVIMAKFKGAPLTGGFNDAGAADPKGINFCAANRADFNKCK
ncbi:MAG: hypothetical protein HQL96_03680 [Magnetococcales bacterium]|nr:hypothetical protein [Magnetococcales bacterium]